MKKLSLTTLIFVFLLFLSNGIQGQTKQLNQLELQKKFLGTWQGNIGKDTVEVWEGRPYGNTTIINVARVIKGKKTPHYVNNLGFDSKADKFKGYTLWPDGNYGTWIGFYSSEKKFLVDLVDNFNPEKVTFKCEMVYTNPKEGIWTGYNTDGVKMWEVKFLKVK
jgi:hypothetical protein